MLLSEITQDKGPTKNVPLKRADFDFDWWVKGNQKMLQAKNEAHKYTEKHAKVETIPFSEIRTAQKSVEVKTVDDYKNGKTRADYPVVQRWNGVNFLFDGHHRVTADIEQGKTEGKFLVMDCWMFDSKGNLTQEWLNEHPLK